MTGRRFGGPVSLHAAERLFLRRRDARPGLVVLARRTLRAVLAGGPMGRDGRALLRTGLAVAAAADRAAGAGELAYHNRHHFAEAAMAMAWLCRAACGVDRLAAAAGVVAMLGHDLGHDGDSAADGRLEAAAAAAVRGIARRAGVSGTGCDRIEAIILATQFDLWRGNARRALRPWPGRGVGRTTATLCLLANEADAFASLLPRLGWRLGEALVVERSAVGGAAAATHAGRAGFLLGFGRFSPAARRLGLEREWRRQLRDYRRAGRMLGAGPGVMAGAAALDGLRS